jgi:MerR family transcriptional regulator, copper efflux regulator
MGELMQIGELARRTDVSQRTIRYYEQLGLLQPAEREGAGYRYYDEQTIKRLEKIAALKNLGLSLEEVVEVIELFFADPSAYVRGKRKTLEILRAHLAEADARLAELKTTRGELQRNILRIESSLENKSA